jgi:hypothetical protein
VQVRQSLGDLAEGRLFVPPIEPTIFQQLQQIRTICKVELEPDDILLVA